jgi:hypothetical protein
MKRTIQPNPPVGNVSYYLLTRRYPLTCDGELEADRRRGTTSTSGAVHEEDSEAAREGTTEELDSNGDPSAETMRMLAM